MNIRTKEDLISVLQQQYQAINDDYIDIRKFITDLVKQRKLDAKISVAILDQIDKMAKVQLKYISSMEGKVEKVGTYTTNNNVVLLDSARNGLTR